MASVSPRDKATAHHGKVLRDTGEEEEEKRRPLMSREPFLNAVTESQNRKG